MRILEANKNLNRSLTSAMLCYSGENIKNDYLTAPRMISVMLKISQTIFTEEVGDCQNYPTGRFQNYGECDQNFVLQYTRENYNLTPFWAVNSLKKVSEAQFYEGNLTGYDDLIDGTKESDCMHPCLSTKVYNLYLL